MKKTIAFAFATLVPMMAAHAQSSAPFSSSIKAKEVSVPSVWPGAKCAPEGILSHVGLPAGMGICEGGQWRVIDSNSSATHPLRQYMVKIVSKTGEVVDEFPLSLRAGGTSAVKLTHGIGYVKSCSAALEKSNTTVSLEPGEAVEGFSVFATLDESGGQGITLDVQHSHLREMRHVKSGDCSIDLPNMDTDKHEFTVDVAVGDGVSTAIEGGAFAVIVTRKPNY